MAGPSQTVAELLRKFGGGSSATSAMNEPTYLGGVPGSHSIKVPAKKKALGGVGPAGIGHAGTIGPRYSVGEQYSFFRGKDPAYISRIQSQLISAGILDRRHGKPGVWTPATASAMEQVMGHANWSGQTWQTALGELVQAGVSAGAAQIPDFNYSPFIAQPFLEPDPKVVRQKVRDVITQIVGDDYITPDLVDKYAAQLLTDYEVQHRQQERVRRMQYNAERKIARNQYDVEYHGASSIDEDDLNIKKKVRVRDPEAELRADLERRFRPVKRSIEDFQKKQGQASAGMSTVLNSLINPVNTQDVNTL